MDRATFGQDEGDSKEPTSTSVARVMPGDLGLTPGNLNSPPHAPSVTATYTPSYEGKWPA